MRSFLTGLLLVIAIFAGLIGALSLITGRSTTGDGSERMVYQNVDGVDLSLWVYKPQGWKAGDKRPCVAWFFGGGWEVGSVEQFAKQASRLAERGMVAVTVDYRVRSRHGTTPFESVDDAIAAMEWLRKNAGALGIDPKRIAAGGGSAGGHLAAGTALFPEDPVPAALVLFNPVVDMEIPAVRRHVRKEMLGTLLEISPFHRIEGPLPPTLIIHGTGDEIVPIGTSKAFAEKARSFGNADVELLPYPGKTHEFYLHGLNANRDFHDTMEKVAAFFERLGWIVPGRDRG